MNYLMESCPKIYLNNPSEWNIQGYSKGGERTGFILFPLKITLDCGVASFINPIASVITHSHCDHTLNIPNLFTHRKKKVKGQEHLIGRPIYMPKACEFPIQRLMEAAILLSDNDPSREAKVLNKEYIWLRQGYHPIIVNPGDHILLHGVQNVKMEILKAYHNTETVGYGFYSVKRKLKNEFKSFSTEQILHAKSKYVKIDYEVISYELVFFCDSTIENLSKHDEWKKYPVIICECTDFPEKHQVNSDRHHTHLNDLEQIMLDNKDKQWILIHTSSSITRNIIDKHQERLRGQKLNVTFV